MRIGITIRDVDRIYVLDQGKIVEEGTHAELTAIKHGIYSSLASLQLKHHYSLCDVNLLILPTSSLFPVTSTKRVSLAINSMTMP